MVGLESVKDPKFRGTIDGNRFTLSPMDAPMVTSLIAVVEGRVEPKEEGGELIRLTIRPNRLFAAGVGFGLAMLTMAAIVFFFSEGASSLLGLPVLAAVGGGTV